MYQVHPYPNPNFRIYLNSFPPQQRQTTIESTIPEYSPTVPTTHNRQDLTASINDIVTRPDHQHQQHDLIACTNEDAPAGTKCNLINDL